MGTVLVVFVFIMTVVIIMMLFGFSAMPFSETFHIAAMCTRVDASSEGTMKRNNETIQAYRCVYSKMYFAHVLAHHSFRGYLNTGKARHRKLRDKVLRSLRHYCGKRKRSMISLERIVVNQANIETVLIKGNVGGNVW